MLIDRLLSLHYSASCFPSIHELSVLLLINPVMVMVSANMMMWFELKLGVHSWVSSVNSMQDCIGAAKLNCLGLFIEEV